MDNQTQQLPVRQSNFELLRIVAMLFIILHHISVHGNWGNGGVFFPEELTINAFFLQTILPLGKIGVNLFVLISGYFLVNSTRDTWPKIAKLWLELLFYSITISLVFVVIDNTELTTRQIVSIFTPVFSYTWWFASTYLLMLALSPFINKMIRSCDEVSHLKLIIGSVIIWVAIPFFTNLSVELSNLTWFIVLYIIAAYIRLYPDRFKRKSITYLEMAIVLFIILMSIAYIVDVTGFVSEFWSIYNPIDHNNRQSSPFSLGISLCLFLAFCKLNIDHKKIVNCVAGTTFGIYLIHDHVLVRESIYSRIFDCLGHTYSDYLIPYVFIIAIAIFLSCMVIELVRKTVIDNVLLKNLDNFVHEKHEMINCGIKKKMGLN